MIPTWVSASLPFVCVEPHRRQCNSALLSDERRWIQIKRRKPEKKCNPRPFSCMCIILEWGSPSVRDPSSYCLFTAIQPGSPFVHIPLPPSSCKAQFIPLQPFTRFRSFKLFVYICLYSTKSNSFFTLREKSCVFELADPSLLTSYVQTPFASVDLLKIVLYFGQSRAQYNTSTFSQSSRT